jgi:hypothetical protein
MGRAAFGGQPFDVLHRLEGYPLLIRRTTNGEVASETRLALPKHVPPLANRYDLPVDFVRRSGPGGGS